MPAAVDSPPLVLLPGMNCTADLWAECGLDDAITPQLDERSISTQVDRLLAELPPVFILGGLSLGGIVAMALACAAPQRVARMILASTNARAPTDTQQQGWRSWLDRLDNGESPRGLQTDILSVLLSPGAIDTRPDLVERTLRMADDTGTAALRAQLHLQTTRTDLLPGLAELNVPTLVISASGDALCPPRLHTDIADAIPGAQRVSTDGPHLLPLEHPTPFGARVRAWRDRPGANRVAGRR